MAALLGAKPMVVQRQNGSWVDGVWVPGALAETFSIVASFQPTSGREREELPELYRTRQTAKLFTQPWVELRTTDLENMRNADLVIFDGRTYEVASVYRWDYHAAPTRHRKYLLAEVGLDGET